MDVNNCLSETFVYVYIYIFKYKYEYIARCTHNGRSSKIFEANLGLGGHSKQYGYIPK